jgi:hypothetical protein
LRAPANIALALAGRRLLNTRLRGIGEITELAIDTGAHTLHAHVSLAGESRPICVLVNRYEVDRSGEHASLTLLDASASRQWLDEALRRFVLGQRITIPPRAAVLLKLLG